MQDIKKVIGTNINTFLALRNMKQKELAQLLGVTDNTISYFCSGKRAPNYEQLLKISDALEVSLDTLLSRPDRRTDGDIIAEASNYTGLSVQAIKNLRSMDSLASTLLSLLLEHDCFDPLLIDLEDLMNLSAALDDAIELANPETVDSSKKLDWLSRVYDNIRLSKYEIRDAFSRIVEDLIPTEDRLATARKILRDAGGYLSSTGGAAVKKRSDEHGQH